MSAGDVTVIHEQSVVLVADDVVHLVEVGVQGPPGAAGGGGGGTSNDIVYPFSFGYVNGAILLAIATPLRLLRARCVITTAFDSPLSTLSLGNLGNVQALIPIGVIAPQIDDEFEIAINQIVSADLVLGIASAGSTQGAGYWVFETAAV
jgi:hypothetical protein